MKNIFKFIFMISLVILIIGCQDIEDTSQEESPVEDTTVEDLEDTYQEESLEEESPGSIVGKAGATSIIIPPKFVQGGVGAVSGLLPGVSQGNIAMATQTADESSPLSPSLSPGIMVVTEAGIGDGISVGQPVTIGKVVKIQDAMAITAFLPSTAADSSAEKIVIILNQYKQCININSIIQVEVPTSPNLIAAGQMAIMPQGPSMGQMAITSPGSGPVGIGVAQVIKPAVAAVTSLPATCKAIAIQNIVVELKDFFEMTVN